MEQKETFSRFIGSLLILLLAGFLLLAVIYFRQLPDNKFHLIFCDVGQGDAILAKTPEGAQVLIDGGPDNSVLSCLGKNMPFYDRNLELLVLTHPQADHLTGLVSVFENYKVEKVLKTPITNKTSEFLAFTEALKNEKSKEFQAISGTKINLEQNLKAEILWPNQSILSVPGVDLNDTSIVLKLSLDNFCAFLTGDATNNVWYQLLSQGQLNNCFLLKIAHHGSKNATNPEFLQAVSPKIAVVSAGANNRYGHPHAEVIERLAERGIKVLRTDQQGNIEIVTDGRKVEIRD